MLLAFTNQNLKSEHQNICVSRPRRFGKSMAANMLVAYYGKGDDSYELFKPFKIAKDPDFKKHLNQYNAIHLNMQQFLGRTESVEEMMEQILPKAEQIPNDFYRKGDTIKAIVKAVEMNNNQPRIILSRTANQFLERLFEQEVPEIFDGLITIKKIVRIPGERAKVAVESYDERIDPVGACVGMKG